jgi:hypothetical protein
MPNMEIIVGTQLSNVAAQTTLDIQGIVTSMKASGMSNSAIKDTLMADLTGGGRIFGNYRNQVKNTVKSGVSMAGSNASKDIFTKAGVEKFRWQTVQGDTVCPDCEPRHGQIESMKVWEMIGTPQSGFSVCQQYCQCQLIAADYKGENLDKPLIREKKKATSIKNVNPSIATATNKGVSDTSRFFKKVGKIDNIIVKELSDGEFAQGGLVNGKKTIVLNSKYYGKNIREYNRIAHEAEDVFKLKKKQDILSMKKTRDSFIASGNSEMATKFDKMIKGLEDWRYSVATSHSNPAYVTGIHESTHAFAKFHKGAEDGFVGSILKNLKSGNIVRNDILAISDYAGVSHKELLAETVALIQTSGRIAVNPKILKIFDDWFDWYFG